MQFMLQKEIVLIFNQLIPKEESKKQVDRKHT